MSQTAPFTDPEGLDDYPAPWFIAEYDGSCTRGGCMITPGDTIRADGEGGWECQECVDYA